MNIKKIIFDEINEMFNEVDYAGLPEFGDHLSSISESGEANGPVYNISFEDISFDEIHYTFETEDNDLYVVSFVLKDRIKQYWETEFHVDGYDHGEIINKGRLIKVMATIVTVMKEFIRKYKPNYLKFQPIKSKGENDMARRNLYLIYLQKNIPPTYFAYEHPPYIIIERKSKIVDKNLIDI